MAEPRNRVELAAEVAAGPDETFTYFTESFGDLWPGKLEPIQDGKEAGEPRGLGFIRRMHTPAGKLEEEIVVHDRPSLIEYKIINGEDATMHNHLGRIEISEVAGGGSRIDYAISYDYRPSFLGPVAAGVLKVTWALRAKRKLRSALG